MNCRITDMRNKDVICIKDGTRLGCICDLEIDVTCAKLVAIIIYGRPRLFGLLGREEDIIIRWNDIAIIGEDAVLVNFVEPARCKRKKPGIMGQIFGSN
ncbi:MAG: YlmC/YmxH family sporulation protein [Clostridiales bacterium]|nr:YlmC/YmxH family sporulation protein [Clostridiales bacterium]